MHVEGSFRRMKEKEKKVKLPKKQMKKNPK
jgi:hypothetical protein